jgi:hypothetical protein
VRITLLTLAVAAWSVTGCGADSQRAKKKDSPSVSVVRAGMTKQRVQHLLGRPDEINELYGLPDLWVDWLYELDNGKAAVTFSKGGVVTRVMNCPGSICTVIVDTTRP